MITNNSKYKRSVLGWETAANDSKVYEGTILIPDISGFSKFVHKTQINIGKRITFRLLSAIMDSNILELRVSEIEGDAILFYQYLKRFSIDEILHQYKVMQAAFNQEILSLSKELGEEIELSLKLIVHHGTIAEYKIGRFKKLYGKTVIEAHRLLKSSVESNSYVLATNEFLRSAAPSQSLRRTRSIKGRQVCDINGELRNIWFTLYDYQSFLKQHNP